MSADLPFQCRCGALRGALRGVSGANGNRAVCYCASCQTFPTLLGCAQEVLDADGGTEIFQTSVARLDITRGLEQLACLRLTRALRWHTRCCNTPVANCAASAAIPIFGLILPADRTRDEADARDRVLGPVRFRVQAQDAARDVSGLGARTGFGLPLAWRVIRLLVRARLSGDHARHPLFDRKTGEPISRPHLVTPEERERAQAAARDPSRATGV